MFYSEEVTTMRSLTAGRSDRRTAPRQTTVLRVALIDDGDNAAFCLLKNVSYCGVQIKTYARLCVGKAIRLFVGEESPIRGRVVWVDATLGGIQFDEELSPARLLRVEQDARAGKNRSSPRIYTKSAARLRTSGRSFPVQLRDISTSGARIRAANVIAAGRSAVLELPGLPALPSFVRWQAAADLGLSFASPLSLQSLSDWLSERTSVSAEPWPEQRRI